MPHKTVLELSPAEQEWIIKQLYGHLLGLHILLLCTQGYNPTQIADLLFCSRSSLYRAGRCKHLHATYAASILFFWIGIETGRAAA